MANPHIISFIQGLSAIESRLVEESLSKSQSLFEKNEVMEVTLFKYIIQNKKIIVSDEMIIEITGTKRVSDLKNNLFNKVLEALTFDKYITNHSLFNENDIVYFTLKKKLFVCRVSLRALNQDKTEAISELLDEIINKAKEFQIYEILVEALNAKKYFKSIRSGLQDFEKISEELSFYEYCHHALLNANDSYYKLILNNGFVKTLSKVEVNKHLSESIKQMEADYKKTKSEQINYYLHIMHFALAERKKDYSSAISYCNKLIAILKKHKVIYRNERMGFVHDNLSLFKTYLKQYGEATKEAQHAQKFYVENSLNYARSKEQEFYTNFYNENFTNAQKCLNELLNHSTIDTGEFLKSQFIYYKACVHFHEKDYKLALALLNESLEIEKDKTRWNVSLRILNIMIFIELDKIDEAFTSLESLRKYMERTGKTDEVSQRDILIVKLLREMQKNGFEYDPGNAATSKMIKQLSEKDSDTSWEYFSSELIPFHEWIKKKFKI
jgi:tetratricopeptide (TPR) repeat protein